MVGSCGRFQFVTQSGRSEWRMLEDFLITYGDDRLVVEDRQGTLTEDAFTPEDLIA